LQALSAGRSASLACSSVSDMSTIAVAWSARASVQASETVVDFVLEQPVMKMKLTVASATAGMILGRMNLSFFPVTWVGYCGRWFLRRAWFNRFLRLRPDHLDCSVSMLLGVLLQLKHRQRI